MKNDSLNPTPSAERTAGSLQQVVMLRNRAESATQAYRDTLENVCRPHAHQMAMRPLDPLPLSKSEEWLIGQARKTAQLANDAFNDWLAQHNAAGELQPPPNNQK